VYDTARAALLALTDHVRFERVAVKVLRRQFPGLRITGPSGDLNRDAFGRPLFGEHDEIVLLVSCEKEWTGKLKRDLGEYGAYPGHDRPEKAIFVTNRSTKQTTQLTWKKWSGKELGIVLEIVDLNELSLELESDELYQVAENDLGVRPRGPRVLQPVAAFRDTQKSRLPGADSPLVGRVHDMQTLTEAVTPSRQPASTRIVVIEGPGGIGKTRLAVDGAYAAATTLVAATGTAVSADCLSDVPLDTPSIVIIDDAHRSPDLSGIAAMLRDPRFAGVKVVLTVPAGGTPGVLDRIGLDRAEAVIIRLAGLDRGEIDQIVKDRGFSAESFRSHVIEVAQGNPWLAHAACAVAAEQPTYSWNDTAELLSELIEHRMRHTGPEPDEHRAAAVALALLTSVKDGEELAALAGAVTALPYEPHRLDILLEDLTEAGIAVGPPYAIRPDAAAPVLAAAALDPGARVKIKLRPALQVLGRAAVLIPPPEPHRGYGVLGIKPLPHDPDCRLPAIDSLRLAARLSVLAQAASQRGDRQTLDVLHQAVRELPDDADVAAWLDILTLAGAVAPAAPRLAADLRDALTRQWPPAPAPASCLWDDDDPARRYRFDIEMLLKQVIAIGEQMGHVDTDRAVSWMLECVWLSHPVLGTLGVRLASQAVRSLLRTRLRTTAQTWDHVFRQRQHVLDAVLRWGRDRRAGPPAGLPATGRAARDPALSAHVLLTAITPLLSVIAEEHLLGKPDAPDAFVWSNYALPDDPRTRTILMSAADAAATLLDHLDTQSPAATPVLKAIVGLPQASRAEAARGLLGAKPLPGYAVQILNEAAARISGAVASHWHLLPLTIRYAAAESTARHGARRGLSLEDLSAAGDPIAAAAADDTAVEQLLTVLPVDQPRQRTSEASSTDRQAENRARAQHLAETLPAGEAAELLTQIDHADASSDQYDCLAAFAYTAGQNAPDPQAILSRLSAETLAASNFLFKGLLQAWPEQALTWLSANIGTYRVALLALSVADEIPPAQEDELLDTITAKLAASGTARPTETDDVHTDRSDATGTGNAYEDEAGLPDLTTQLASHLTWCRAQPRNRLTKLVTLSSCASDRALPRILAAIDRILHTPPGQLAIAGEDNQTMRRSLVGILARALTPANGISSAGLDYDTATAAEALGRTAPAETAQMLTDRTLSATLSVIPSDWEEMLTQTPAHQREPLAVAYQELIEQHLTAQALTSQTETMALDVLSVLGRGTPRWTDLIRSWAAGNAIDRVHAASAIRRCWQDPIWAELVPQLIDAGLDEQAMTQLRQGLLCIEDGVDALGASTRLNALQPLLSDIRPAVCQFAAEISDTLHALLSPLPPASPHKSRR
jgi:hypothetical protein